MWRIVKIENDQLVLIYNEKGNRVVWDDRFNTERNRTDGINDYSVSRIYDNLTAIYKNDTIFNKNTRNLLAILVKEVNLICIMIVLLKNRLY